MQSTKNRPFFVSLLPFVQDIDRFAVSAHCYATHASSGIHIAAPPSGSLVNDVERTVAGTVFDAQTIRIPAGLYFATRPIILFRPEAQLVIDAGARIMFRPLSAIRVHQGTLQVLGTLGNPVEFTSTSTYLNEYDGNSSIANSTEWGGVWFGPDANSSVLVDTEYIEGSLLRHCRIVNAGFDVFEASIEMEETTVLLDHVHVLGSGQHGLSLKQSSASDMVLRHVYIDRSNGDGILSSNSNGPLLLNNVNITRSAQSGADLRSHRDVRITDCQFSSNGDTQVYSNFGSGELTISSR